MRLRSGDQQLLYYIVVLLPSLISVKSSSSSDNVAVSGQMLCYKGEDADVLPKEKEGNSCSGAMCSKTWYLKGEC